MIRPRLLLLAAASALTGCTLLLDWSEPDGGVGVVCSECPLGCNGNRTACLSDNCQNRICGSGYVCVDRAGGSACEPVGNADLGRNCDQDISCGPTPPGATRVCLNGAFRSQLTGDPLRGICAELCGAGDACATPGTVCRAFPLALDAGVTRVCLPEKTLTPCRTTDDCERAGMVCSVFQNPLAGAITVCDAPAPGPQPGAACTASANNPDAGICQNGLCLTAGGTSSCSETCVADSCGTRICTLVPFGVKSGAAYVPLCAAGRTECNLCNESDRSLCGADAPQCIIRAPLPGRCLSPCGQPGNTCPNGGTCESLAGVLYCLPPGGCP